MEASEAPVKSRGCPMLVRVFLRFGQHNAVSAYESGLPQDELHFYLWPLSTLRDLTELISEVKPGIRRPRVQLSFAIVYPDKRGRQTMKNVSLSSSFLSFAQVGEVNGHATSRPSAEDQRTLQALRFEAGDFLDVAVLGLDNHAADQRRTAPTRRKPEAPSRMQLD